PLEDVRELLREVRAVVVTRRGGDGAEVEVRGGGAEVALAALLEKPRKRPARRLAIEHVGGARLDDGSARRELLVRGDAGGAAEDERKQREEREDERQASRSGAGRTAPRADGAGGADGGPGAKHLEPCLSRPLLEAYPSWKD